MKKNYRTIREKYTDLMALKTVCNVWKHCLKCLYLFYISPISLL